MNSLERLHIGKIKALDEGPGFDELMHFAVALSFIRRCSNLGPNGVPRNDFLNSSENKYVMEVSKFLTLLNSCISKTELLIRQAEAPPPEEWLTELQITKHDFLQERLDTSTLVLHSAIDRGLSLTSVALQLPIAVESSTYKNIKDLIKETHKEVLLALDELREVVFPLHASRNAYAHRGENRCLGIFSDVKRLYELSPVFNFPLEVMQINEVGAMEELVETIEKDKAAVERRLLNLKTVLRPHCLQILLSLKALELPNEQEITRYSEAMTYFRGGSQPKWLILE